MSEVKVYTTRDIPTRYPELKAIEHFIWSPYHLSHGMEFHEARRVAERLHKTGHDDAGRVMMMLESYARDMTRFNRVNDHSRIRAQKKVYRSAIRAAQKRKVK